MLVQGVLTLLIIQKTSIISWECWDDKIQFLKSRCHFASFLSQTYWIGNRRRWFPKKLAVAIRFAPLNAQGATFSGPLLESATTGRTCDVTDVSFLLRTGRKKISCLENIRYESIASMCCFPRTSWEWGKVKSWEKKIWEPWNSAPLSTWGPRILLYLFCGTAVLIPSTIGRHHTLNLVTVLMAGFQTSHVLDWVHKQYF